MWKMILADGTELTGFQQNGDNYVHKTKVDESVFDGNLSTLTLTDGETEIVMQNAVLVQQVHYADGWYLCFRELSPQEKAMERIEGLLTSNAESITDVQMALAEVYELILGGGI